MSEAPVEVKITSKERRDKNKKRRSIRSWVRRRLTHGHPKGR